MVAGLADQRGRVLPLESDRGAFGVVFIVSAGLAQRVDDPGKLTLQPGQPLKSATPFSCQQLCRALLLHHPSGVPGLAMR